MVSNDSTNGPVQISVSYVFVKNLVARQRTEKYLKYAKNRVFDGVYQHFLPLLILLFCLLLIPNEGINDYI